MKNPILKSSLSALQRICGSIMPTNRLAFSVCSQPPRGITALIPQSRPSRIEGGINKPWRFTQCLTWQNNSTSFWCKPVQVSSNTKTNNSIQFSTFLKTYSSEALGEPKLSSWKTAMRNSAPQGLTTLSRQTDRFKSFMYIRKFLQCSLPAGALHTALVATLEGIVGSNSGGGVKGTIYRCFPVVLWILF